MMGCVQIQYSVRYIDMHAGPVWSCVWVCVCLHVSLTDVALYAQPDPHQREHACKDLFKNRCSLGWSSNIYYSLSHSLSPTSTQPPPTHTQTHRTSWSCITGRQKVILARLANLCERPLWLCRIKPLALLLFYRSSSEVLPVLGGSRWRDGICQPFVSSHVSCSLLRCATYTNGSLPSYLQISGSSSVSALMPQRARHIGIHSEIFMCGTAVLSSGQKV